MAVNLLDCNNLHECDEYFERNITSSWLGDLEPGEGEIDHLSDLIFQALKNHLNLHNSLSVAVFLVWMGWLHYQEGNFWESVYQQLGLPAAQIRWQRILGEVYLRAVKEYNLTDFQGKLRYISSILAHGYIPNWYHENYFEDVILDIYIDREKTNLLIQEEEIAHFISSWCSDYAGYEKYQNKKSNLEIVEDKLLSIRVVRQHKNLLLEYKSLKEKLIPKSEAKELLDYPMGWLDQLELEQSECEKQHNHLWGQIEKRKSTEIRYKMFLEAQKVKLKVLETEIGNTAEQILEKWNEDLASFLMDLPANKVNELASKIKRSRRALSGIKGWLLRFFTPKKYRRFRKDKEQLNEIFKSLPVYRELLADPWPVLPRTLFRLQALIEQHAKITPILVEIDIAYQEAAASAADNTLREDLESQKKRLDKLTQELALYKSKLVRLGMGNLEDGIAELSEQREMLRKIDLLRSQIPGDADKLITYIPLSRRYKDEKKLERRLISIRKRKKENEEYLKIFKDPLYTQNESTRIFILQGGEKAIQLIYDSLLFVDGLQKNETDWTIALPNRIKRSMRRWWLQKGKNLLEKSREEKVWERLETDGIYTRKPVIKFDPIHKEFRVVLPQQPVREKAEATFSVQGESGQKQTISLPLILEKDFYLTEAAELKLERPEPRYSLRFSCGDTIRNWEINGIGLDGFYMLFNLQGELIKDNQLPKDGVYLIAPAGSHVDPAEAVKETLPGLWSNYEYRLLELRDNPAIIVQFEEDVSIFKSQDQLQPVLLSREVINGLTVEGALAYQERLPDLLFSLKNPKEIQFYGLRIDTSSEIVYQPLNELDFVIDRDNVVHLPLEEMIDKKYGLFKITLTKRSDTIWTEQCAVVPHLELDFDRSAYAVQDSSRSSGRLNFHSKYKCEFIPNHSAEAAKQLSSNVVEFDTSLNEILGCLVFPLKQRLAVEISVEVPGICWRETGSSWKREIDEIWHEDLGDIEVKIPSVISKPIALTLEKEKQVLSSPVVRGIAKFSLPRFSDTLLESSSPIQEIVLNCDDHGIPPSILLRVRTCWQTAKVSLTQSLQGDSRHFVIEWEDLGRATDRVARLWPLNMPENEPFEKAIPDGANSLSLSVPVKILPSGRYRLQLIAIDPWVVADKTIPEKAAENCIDIDIGTKEEHLANYLNKRLKITALYHGDQGAELENHYWIKVLELNPTFEGEVRLVGNLYSLAPDGTDVEMPYNPVSFYIDGNKMPFLIDRDGDGATYCRKCKVMFWEVAHKKCGDAVIAPDTIHIKVEG